MSKRNILVATIAATFTFTSCGTTGTTQTTPTTDALGAVLGSVLGTDGAEAANSILGNLLGGLLTKGLTEQSLYGTWTYRTPEVRFESENVLSQAGGQVVAANIEKKMANYLSKVGITAGVSTFTFNKDKTFSIQTKGTTVSTGTYTFDANAKTLTLNGTLGLMNQTCTIGMDGTNLCLLFEADKLLSIANTVGSALGKANSTIGTVAGVLGSNYKGMKLGFQLSK